MYGQNIKNLNKTLLIISSDEQISLDICHKKLAAIYCISYMINIAYIGNIKEKCLMANIQR